MKVLIVDDHALFRVGLQGLLERRGLQVVGAAAEGEEGLRLVETLKPDVVLLDLRMPDLGGLSVLRHIVEQGLEIPVVMLPTRSCSRCGHGIDAFIHGRRTAGSALGSERDRQLATHTAMTMAMAAVEAARPCLMPALVTPPSRSFSTMRSTYTIFSTSRGGAST